MVKDESFFEVARSKNAIYVGVRGLGNLGNAPVFNEFAEKMIAEGWSRFVIDLEHCRGVDSTFMGTLLGISRSCTDQAADGAVVLINTSPHCRKQLSSIGLDAFLVFHEGSASAPKSTMRRLDAREVSSKERLSLILKAHRDLIAADDRNETKFGPFLRSILSDH